MTESRIVAGYLEWAKGLRGFTASKRPASAERPASAKIVDSYPLNPDEYRMTIAILEVRYPCRARLEEETSANLEEARG